MRSLIAMLAVAGMFLAGPAFADDDDDDGPGNGPPCFITGTCGGGGGGDNTNTNTNSATGGNATADAFGLGVGVAGAGVFDSGNSSSTSSADNAFTGSVSGSVSNTIGGPGSFSPSSFSGVDFEDAAFGNSTNDLSVSGAQDQDQRQRQSQRQSQGNEQDTNVDIDASDRSTTIVEDRKDPVASAAPVFASACSAGVSAQSYGFGGALANTNPMCDLALAVELAIKVDNFELANELTDRAARFAKHRTNPVRMYGQWIPFLGQLF